MHLSLIDLGEVRPEEIDLVNSCYQLWREIYTPILQADNKQIDVESFYRPKMLSVIHTGSQVHSFSLHNILDLHLIGVDQLRYFLPMPQDVLERLRGEHARLFTIEWITVHPDQQKRFSKISQADLIMGLSIRAMAHSHCDAAVGFSRVDERADRIASKYGAQAQASTEMLGIACNVMLARREWFKAHPFATVESVLNELWKNKSNHTSYIKDGDAKGADEIAAA
jgi:hypothetical protein